MGFGLDSTNQKNATSRGGWERGGHNEANYEGVAAGQGLDYAAAMGPMGINWQIVAAGEEVGGAVFSDTISAAGNLGQASIIEIMGFDVFMNAAIASGNQNDSAFDYLYFHCPYPSAVEQLLMDAGDAIDAEMEFVLDDVIGAIFG